MSAESREFYIGQLLRQAERTRNTVRAAVRFGVTEEEADRLVFGRRPVDQPIARLLRRRTVDRSAMDEITHPDWDYAAVAWAAGYDPRDIAEDLALTLEELMIGIDGLGVDRE